MMLWLRLSPSPVPSPVGFVVKKGLGDFVFDFHGYAGAVVYK
jgi:hypothetical protein